nr:hypothetical protein 2 [Micrococcaceae bacterium]
MIDVKKCSQCNEVKCIDNFTNYRDRKGELRKRSYCNDCRNNWRRERAKNFPIEHKIKQCAANLIRRLTVSSDKPANKSYKEKGIKSLIGSNTKEVYDYLYKHHYDDFKHLLDKGVVPSIDRIDSDKHYEPGNIRIISFEENSRLGREQSLKVCQKPIRITYEDGRIEEYAGAKDGAKKSSISINIIYKVLVGKTKQKKEFFVEYI